MTKCFVFTTLLFSAFLLCTCTDEEQPTGKVKISFDHRIHGAPISFNEMIYENVAGNPYEIKEIQWFISDVTLVTKTGKEIILQRDDFCHYIDTNLPTTAAWAPSDNVPADSYTAIKFTFGLKGEKNIPGQFTDMPESGMIWPMELGGDHGGYHYMKMNGFWRNTEQVRTPFNFHLGVGQLYDDNHQVTSFVQNWFEVTLPAEFTIKENDTFEFRLRMSVDKWFDDPYIYDFNIMGGMTMTNQVALEKIRGNGQHAFSVELNPL